MDHVKYDWSVDIVSLEGKSVVVRLKDVDGFMWPGRDATELVGVEKVLRIDEESAA